MQHPSEMTPAELRCLRRSLGLTIRALGKAIGYTYQSITQWEAGTRPLSPRAAAALADLVAFTDETVHALADQSVIVTYWDDAEFLEHEDTGGWVLSAEWHQAVAWRAKEQNPGTVVTWRT